MKAEIYCSDFEHRQYMVLDVTSRESTQTRSVQLAVGRVILYNTSSHAMYWRACIAVEISVYVTQNMKISFQITSRNRNPSQKCIEDSYKYKMI